MNARIYTDKKLNVLSQDRQFSATEQQPHSDNCIMTAMKTLGLEYNYTVHDDYSRFLNILQGKKGCVEW